MDYLAMNRAAWNAKTAVHVDSAFYDMPGFLAGNSTLKSPELGLLGEVRGKKICICNATSGRIRSRWHAWVLK